MRVLFYMGVLCASCVVVLLLGCLCCFVCLVVCVSRDSCVFACVCVFQRVLLVIGVVILVLAYCVQ